MTAACGAPASSAPETGADQPARTATASTLAATQEVSVTPTGTPLHTRLAASSAVGNTGQALTAVIAGTTYRSATGVWIGCEGTAATAVYRLGGEFAELTGVVGLQPHTPRGLHVKISFSVDGVTELAPVLTRDDRPRTISVPLAGARSLTVAAIATDGWCAPAPAPYGAIGAASLT